MRSSPTENTPLPATGVFVSLQRPSTIAPSALQLAPRGRRIAERVSRGHIHLQETLVDDLLRDMLAHPLVRAARVSTEKPDVYPDCDAVGVEVFGLRADRAR